MEVHLSFPGVLEILRRAPKFGQAFSNLAAELRQPARAKENKRGAQNDKHFSAAQRIENQQVHGLVLIRLLQSDVPRLNCSAMIDARTECCLDTPLTLPQSLASLANANHFITTIQHRDCLRLGT